MHKTTLASAFPDSNVSSTFSLLFRVRFLSFNSVVFSLSIFQELRDVTFDVVARKSNDGSHHPPTYPSLKLTFCPKWQESVNVVLGEGYVVDSQKRLMTTLGLRGWKERQKRTS